MAKIRTLSLFKKIISLVILLNILSYHTVYADIDDDEEIDIEEIKNETIQTAANVTNEPKINSRIALVYDRNSRENFIRKKWIKASTHGKYYKNYDLNCGIRKCKFTRYRNN